MTTSSTPSDPTPHLRRDLSLVHVWLAGVGIILGAGIYVLIGEAADQSGSLVWLSFVIP